MESVNRHVDTNRYARCIEVSKRIRWDFDDVMRSCPQSCECATATPTRGPDPDI